jgi:site-specific recombinase XerD
MLFYFLKSMQKLITAHDIHHYERRLEHALSTLDSDESLSKKNRELILSYIKYRNAQGLSIPRQVRYIFTLRKLARLLNGKSFREAKEAGSH